MMSFGVIFWHQHHRVLATATIKYCFAAYFAMIHTIHTSVCSAPSGAGIWINLPSSAFAQALATSEETESNLSSSYLSIKSISTVIELPRISDLGATRVNPIGMPLSLANPGILMQGTCKIVHIAQNLESPVWPSPIGAWPITLGVMIASY